MSQTQEEVRQTLEVVAAEIKLKICTRNTDYMKI